MQARRANGEMFPIALSVGEAADANEIEQRARARYASMDELLAQADFVVLQMPYSPDTHHLIGAAQLALAKPGQLMINVGRGSVVNEDAVADALHTGKLSGYAADVFACEDWALPDRPTAIPQRLLAHPATLFTPHIGSAVRRVRMAIEHRAADNIIAVLEGREPADAINVPSRVAAAAIAAMAPTITLSRD